MATPTIPLPTDVDVSLGSELTTKARVLKAQFGDGYTQRAGDGLNTVVSTYSVSFNTLTRDEAQTILDFFAAQKGYKAFKYRVKGESADRLWVCEEWAREHVTSMLDNVKCTWIEVFAP